MDGLLVDTEPVHYEAWKKVFEKHGASLPKHLFLKFVGRGNDYVAGWLMSQQGIVVSPEELIREKTLFLSESLDKVQPMPHVPKLLEKLRGRKGITLSVASSSQKSVVVKLLGITGLIKFFDFINAGDEVERTKPAPDVYILALKRAGIPAQESVAIEDSEAGVIAAKKAGLKCIAVPSPYTQHSDFSAADEVLSSLKEVLDGNSSLIKI